MKHDAIVINVPSRAGKTSLSKALQAAFATQNKTLLHMPIDSFWQMVPSHIHPSSETFPHMKGVIRETCQSFLKYEMPFVLDTVLYQKSYSNLKKSFKNKKILYIGLTADEETLNAREKERGDRTIGLSASQLSVMHSAECTYDLFFNTSHTHKRDMQKNNKNL